MNTTCAMMQAEAFTPLADCSPCLHRKAPLPLAHCTPENIYTHIMSGRQIALFFNEDPNLTDQYASNEFY